MSDSTFVRTMVALRRVAADSGIDSVARDSARRTVLREQRVTAKQIDSAARALGLEPMRAEQLFQTIENQVARRQPPGLPKP